MDGRDQIIFNVLAYGCVAVPGGAIVALLFEFRPQIRFGLLSPPHEWTVRWHWPDVIFAFLLMLLIPGTTYSLLKSTGFYTYLQVEPVARQMLYSAVFDFPLLLGFLFFIFKRRLDIGPGEIGFNLSRWPQNLTWGYLGFVIITPLVLGTYFLALYLFQTMGIGSDKHSVESLLEENLLPVEWVLIFFRVAVVAAVTEELVFRALLLRWLKKASLFGHVVLLIATIGFALLYLLSVKKEAGQIVAIVVFACLLAGGYFFLLCWWLLGSDESGFVGNFVGEANAPTVVAVYGSSMLWAMFHVSIWPSPIPLFIMGLGLGWLAWRTQSLIAPIFWHSLFNCVAFAVLVFSAVNR